MLNIQSINYLLNLIVVRVVSFFQAFNRENYIGLNEKFYPEARLSWNHHVSTWTNNPLPKLIIRYEDLHKNQFKYFRSIVTFINKFLNNKIELSDDEIEEIIKSKELKYVAWIDVSLFSNRSLSVGKTKDRHSSAIAVTLQVYPLLHSHSTWNNNKGGSDTILKSLANCPALLHCWVNHTNNR